MRNGRDIFNADDLNAVGIQSANGGFAAAAHAFDKNIGFAKTVGRNFFGRFADNNAGGLGGGFLRAAKSGLAGRALG